MKLTSDPRVEANSILSVLENGYGIDFEKAVWAIGCWCKAQGIAWQRPSVSTDKSRAIKTTAEESKIVSNVVAAVKERECPSCHTVNDIDSRFCRKCGTSLVSLCPNCGAEYHDEDTFCSKCGHRLDSDTETPQFTLASSVYKTCQEGDSFHFGNYTQGPSGEVLPIEWLVLKRTDDKLMVITRWAMNCRQYHHVNENITWENCDLRRWLNGEFFSKAFNTTEKECIMPSMIDNWDNDKYGTPGGNATFDNVFLLSLDEANTLFKSDTERICKPTSYAASKGAYIDEGNCLCWLRSPGVDPIYASFIGSNGIISTEGNFVSDSDDCVRPVVFLKL
ncbi:MAG: DUF6273 domain-containing protein [bacterium]|nr:DUF6273 domain-containing protein [bacterium]